MNAKQLIAAERARQIEVEGCSAEHDDKYSKGELLSAALSYRDAADEFSELPATWPWPASSWKPKSRQRNLERAGALYQAAADAFERVYDYEGRNDALYHVASCTILLDSILKCSAK